MLFSFGSQAENGLFSFVQNDAGHVYTWPSEKLAMQYFKGGELGHLYQIDPDLSFATLIRVGDKGLVAPQLIELNERQKVSLYNSFIYKSLLAWAPRTETILV